MLFKKRSLRLAGYDGYGKLKPESMYETWVSDDQDQALGEQEWVKTRILETAVPAPPCALS